jgi:hypothetical protein
MHRLGGALKTSQQRLLSFIVNPTGAGFNRSAIFYVPHFSLAEVFFLGYN